MSRVVKRSASQAVKSGRSQRDAPLPRFVLPQLFQLVEKLPSGPQWMLEIKLDGFRMAARIDNGRVQLLTLAVCESQSGLIFERSARLGSPDVDHKVSALERAFQLARSGRVANVEDIKKEVEARGLRCQFRV
jgi:hypothetical protein